MVLADPLLDLTPGRFLKHRAKGWIQLRYPHVDERDERLMEWCREIARICISEEFKRLNRDLVKVYRRNGIDDPFRIAFQDSLFSLFTEQDDDRQVSIEYS